MTLHLLIAAWLATFTGQTPTVCTPGEHYMLVVDAHVPASEDAPAACVRIPVVTICGEPHRLAWTIDDEARAGDCTDLDPGAVRRVDTAVAYPHSVVGHVQRDAVGEEPAVPPYVGVCQQPGCRCASEACEHIPIGGPNSVADDPPYYCVRLRRLHPEATCP